ncbi:uncharacterized protein [Amphiura filiformis]|uniref:uncharacterized protein isoform X2 n=1 Tax=Amphiura filiformis TaxID=82378 RepID=UPI003B223C65
MAQGNSQANDSQADELRSKFSSAYSYLSTCTDYMSKESSDIFAMLSSESLAEDTRLMKSDILAELGFGQLFVQMWRKIPNKNSLQRMQRLSMVRAYWNYTDLSEKLCLELGKAGALDLLLQDLHDLKGSKATQTNDQINSNLTILYNCAHLCDEDRCIFRRFSSKENRNAVEILYDFLNDPNLVNKTLSLLTLSYIVAENENEKLATTGTGGCLSFLVSLLEESIKYANHRATSVIFSTEELLAGLNQLAENDANKVKIVEEGVIPILAKILKDKYNEKEQELAARAFWRLAFVACNREVICKSEDAITALQELKTCASASVRESCSGALWELFEGQVEDTSIEQNDTIKESADDVALHTPHVMISYQWDSQEQMIKVKERLTSAGYNIWMDVDKMEGNILSTMADAVENAEVVLVALSRKYKESTNCRTEASYAYKLKKPIVPLLVEPDYDPDGWLGALAGMLLYYRAHSDEALNTDLNSLVKELGNKDTKAKPKQITSNGTSKPQITSNGQQISSASNGQQTPSARPPTKTPKESEIASWSKDQVQSWLDDKDLEAVKIQVASYCDGKHLLQMYWQFRRSPSFFETGLKNDLNLDFHSIIKFITALDDLFTS